MLGSFSQVIDSYGDNSSRSESRGSQGGGQTSRGESANYALHERPLLRIEEVMRLPSDELIVFPAGAAFARPGEEAFVVLRPRFQPRR